MLGKLTSKRGCLIREETYDDKIVSECYAYTKEIDFKDKIVLDMGACFGGFAHVAREKGAKLVVSYEPDPENYELLKLNAERLGSVECKNKAIVLDPSREVFLYRLEGINKGAHSTVPIRGRDKIKVEGISFLEELEKYKPSILKIDIEGGEYDLLREVEIPSFVYYFILEIHTNNTTCRKKLFPELFKKLSQNFEFIQEPRDSGANRHTTAIMRRKNGKNEIA